MLLKMIIKFLIAVNSLLMVSSALFLFGGSLELFPTDEQREKEWIAFGLLFIFFLMIGVVLLVINSKINTRKLSSDN